MGGIDRIQDRTEAIFNQSFDAAVDAACVLYMFNEVCRILNLSTDEVYTPSSGLIQHLLCRTVISLNDRWTTLQWQIEMADKVREAMRRHR